MACDDARVIRTERLLMRRWRDEDREPFAALNADPAVMEHMQGTLTARAVRRVHRPHRGLVGRAWLGPVGDRGARRRAVHRLHGPVAGGLRDRRADGRGRLAHGPRALGNGYVTEAAREALRFGFEEVGLDEIVSFTVPQNERSWRVMERIGLRRDPSGDFDHPNVDAEAYPHLVRHVFYRLGRNDWLVAGRRPGHEAPELGRARPVPSAGQPKPARPPGSAATPASAAGAPGSGPGCSRRRCRSA